MRDDANGCDASCFRCANIEADVRSNCISKPLKKSFVRVRFPNKAELETDNLGRE